MRRLSAVFGAFLVVLGVSGAWPRKREFPRYEPPSFEELPGTGLPDLPESKLNPEISRPSDTPAVSAPMPTSPVDNMPVETLPVVESPTLPDLQVSAPVEAPESAPVAAAVPVADAVPEPAPTAVEPAQRTDSEARPSPPPTFKKPYKVWIWQERGDCLWRIAERVYGDRHKWPLIYQANRDIIKDPNRIYPKQKLKIPPPDWQP